LKTEVLQKADESRNLFNDVGDNLVRKAERAGRLGSPSGVGRNKKRDFYA